MDGGSGLSACNLHPDLSGDEGRDGRSQRYVCLHGKLYRGIWDGQDQLRHADRVLCRRMRKHPRAWRGIFLGALRGVHTGKGGKRPYGGISPDPSGQPCPDRDLQAGRGGAADRDPECGHLCGFHRLHCGDWGGDSLERGVASASGLSAAADRDCGGLLRDLSLSKAWRYGDRAWRGGRPVFSEPDRQYHRQRGISTVYHTLRVCGRFGYCDQRESGMGAGRAGAGIWSRGDCGGIYEVLQEGYCVKGSGGCVPGNCFR